MALLPLHILLLLLIQNIVVIRNVLSAPWTRLQNKQNSSQDHPPFSFIGSILMFINGYSGLIHASVSSGPLQYSSLFRRHCSICSLPPSPPSTFSFLSPSLSIPLPSSPSLSLPLSFFLSFFSLLYSSLSLSLCLFISPLSPLYLTPFLFYALSLPLHRSPSLCLSPSSSLSIIVFPFLPPPSFTPSPFLPLHHSLYLPFCFFLCFSIFLFLPLSLVLSIFAEPDKPQVN